MSNNIKSIKLKRSALNKILEELLKFMDAKDYEIEYKNFVVRTPTQEDFNELMRLYKIAGWKIRQPQKVLSGLFDEWKFYKQKTCVDFGDYFTLKNRAYYYNTRSHGIIYLEQARKKLEDMYPHKDFSQNIKTIKICRIN